jgi:hypothetical protein
VNEKAQPASAGRDPQARTPVTGHPDGLPPDRAKYGLVRQPDDGAAAAEAQRLNNAEPEVYEAVDGRCPVDGLPAGNCAHLPGPQDVIAPDGGLVYEEGHGYPEKKARAADRDGTEQARR